MPYCRLFYHFIWTTKNRQPWIIPGLEPLLFDSIRSKTIGLGARIFAVNSYRDHVHLVVSVPPAISLSRFIGQVKGIASLRINQSEKILGPVYWQEEYGVFSLDETGLLKCISYVERQKEHHGESGEIRKNWEVE